MLIQRIDHLEEHLSAKSKWWGLYPVAPPPKPKPTTNTTATTVATAAPAPGSEKSSGADTTAVPVIAVPVVTPTASSKTQDSLKQLEPPTAVATPAQNPASSQSSPTAS